MKNLLNNLSKEVLMEMVVDLSAKLQTTQETLMMAESHILYQDSEINELSDTLVGVKNELISANQQITMHNEWLEEQEFIGINNYLYQENPEPEEVESDIKELPSIRSEIIACTIQGGDDVPF